jgi:hypothetical protein
MTLKQATDQVSAAIEAGDFDELKRALAARRDALESGEKTSVETSKEIFETGERALAALKALAQRTAFDSVRLGQIKRYADFHR